jgi:hypothetical protein
MPSEGACAIAQGLPIQEAGEPVTRICMQCKHEFGEKCPECGINANAAQGMFSIAPVVFYQCPNPECLHAFPEGEGGLTYGLCEECRISWGLSELRG